MLSLVAASFEYSRLKPGKHNQNGTAEHFKGKYNFIGKKNN
jgi:hypothetical protein